METLREVRRCTQEDILINTFMLENNYQLVNFVDRMTRINRGRAFYHQRVESQRVRAGGLPEQPAQACDCLIRLESRISEMLQYSISWI